VLITLETSFASERLISNTIFRMEFTGYFFLHEHLTMWLRCGQTQLFLSEQKNWPESDAGCIEGLFLWREDSSAINSESYRGYYKEDKQANQIASGCTILLLVHFFCPALNGNSKITFFCLQHMISQAQTSASLT
jgi:hypothetical protein